jgi:hypothetical protein
LTSLEAHADKGAKTLKRPSLALMMLIIFWIAYCVVAAYALYQALPPLNRELLWILGGAAVFSIVATFAFLSYARFGHSIDNRTLSIPQTCDGSVQPGVVIDDRGVRASRTNRTEEGATGGNEA